MIGGGSSRAAASLASGIVAALASVPTATAQAWTSWSVHWENDSFVLPDYQTDEAYTNGVRFTIGRNPDPDAAGGWGWTETVRERLQGIIPGRRPFGAVGALVFGQNFFTPVVITTFDPDPEDRPFSAHLYGGMRVDITEDEPPDPRARHARLQHSLEVDVGFVGPLALADQVQTGVHLLRQSRIPKGWERQLRTELAVNASYLGRAKLGWHFLDVVPHAGLALGTVQTFGNAGATARVGWNMSSFPTVLNPWTAVPTAARPSWEIALAAGVEGRWFLRNAYVDGGLLGGSPGVDREPGVWDLRVGLTGRIRSWTLTYTHIRRSPEFDIPARLGDGEHYFGSFSLSRELGGGRAGGGGGGGGFWRWARSDWMLEAGIGGAFSRDHGDGSDATADGMSMRAGVAKGIVGPFALGAEIVGALREGAAPDDDGRHRDTFLLNRVVTAAWRPELGRHRGRPGRLILRAGAGRALAKVEATRGLERDTERSDTGTGWLGAVGYDLPLSPTFSLGLDLTWSRLQVGRDDRPDASFLSTTFGFKVSP
jgi:hypothetical protein